MPEGDVAKTGARHGAFGRAGRVVRRKRWVLPAGLMKVACAGRVA